MSQRADADAEGGDEDSTTTKWTYHELGDHAVESGALVSEALLSRAQGAEVFGGAGYHIGAESHLDAAEGAATGSHIKENDGVRHW